MTESRESVTSRHVSDERLDLLEKVACAHVLKTDSPYTVMNNCELLDLIADVRRGHKIESEHVLACDQANKRGQKLREIAAIVDRR